VPQAGTGAAEIRRYLESTEFRRENMQRNLIDEDQLRAVPRIQGYEDPDQVKEASMECNRQLSVISHNGE
jgi:uncharacterized membrane protein YcaP (DUF421 family)